MRGLDSGDHGSSGFECVLYLSAVWTATNHRAHRAFVRTGKDKCLYSCLPPFSPSTTSQQGFHFDALRTVRLNVRDLLKHYQLIFLPFSESGRGAALVGCYLLIHWVPARNQIKEMFSLSLLSARGVFCPWCDSSS